MNRASLLILTAFAAIFFAACATSSDNALVTNTNANANAADPASTAPLAETLLVREREANEAYFKGDVKYFDKMLSDKFVTLGPRGLRMDKAATIKMIAGNKCDIKDGWKLDEGHVSTIDRNTFVLTYKGTLDGTCTVNGKTEKVPSPIRAATVWVRSGDKWLAAFHGENLIVDPTAPPANSNTGLITSDQPKVAADANTETLVKAELTVWEAWKSHDAKKLEELTANDLSFVDIFGTVANDKQDTIKLWAENRCEVKSVNITDGVATSISPTVSILTFKGIAAGTCFGQKIGGPIFGTSVYVRDVDTWKSAFTINSPD